MGQQKGLNLTYQINPGFHTNAQLKFNLNALDAENLGTKFKSPQAILIQHIGRPLLAAPVKIHSNKNNPKSPVKFTHLSGEKLMNAMKLAKDDIKLAKRRQAMHQFAVENEIENINGEPFTAKPKIDSKKNVKKTSQNLVYINQSPHKSSLRGKFKHLERIEQSIEAKEIDKLRRQLQTYIENVERVSSLGKFI